ncbi:glycerophosphodiester phosphodiesterase [Pedobacter yulinensis]|uniref:Glycerophosphodiester phosphodiesterase n=1 Tax=Pedobacter yulinensis TaxID=2126353 RepID=A0A2T3HH11_9SPHI|nr:glycerophosphodiester phosphodiesterase family protein [Pedobacter yulinensis]PST81736.1 glycerophosphodiester phosphodiesterase [Pedobacter yulinensis]
MKKIVLLFIVVLWAGVLAAQQKFHRIDFKTPSALQAFLQRKTAPYPLLSAHRGGPMPGYPENCIETFENAARLQPVIIEFDVALSRDSALVVMHDDRLDRTTTGSGPVGEHTLAQLSELRLRDNEGRLTAFRIPTLDQVLKWGSGKVLFTIDIKRGVPYRMVIDAVRRNKAENRSIIITYSANQAAEVHRLAPDLMISASVGREEDLARLNSMGVPDNRIVAFTGTSARPASLYTLLHSRGVTAIMGTMGNIDRQAKAKPDAGVYTKLVELGADVLSTDELQLAGKELDAYRRKSGMRLKALVVR